MKTIVKSSIVILLFLFVAACSGPKAVFVLLENENGKPGAIEVTTDGGSVILDKPGFAVNVEDKSKPPEEQKQMDQKKINDIFSQAIMIQPEKPMHFLLYFEMGTASLTEESQKLMLEVIDIVKNRKIPDVYVIGHTDRVGSEEYNFTLSLKRAAYVKEMLVVRGIPSDAIQVFSHGENNPVIPTEDEVPEPKNRRVEIVIR